MLYNDVESCAQNLRSLKLDTTGYGSLLIPILKERLPDEINMIIWGDHLDFDQVLEHFNDELRAQRNCASISINMTNGRVAHLLQVAYMQKLGVHDCNKIFHQSVPQTVSGHESRKAILRRKGRCFICLDSGHVAKDCTSTYVCRRCKKCRHHISICKSAPIDSPNDSKRKRGRRIEKSREGAIRNL